LSLLLERAVASVTSFLQDRLDVAKVIDRVGRDARRDNQAHGRESEEPTVHHDDLEGPIGGMVACERTGGSRSEPRQLLDPFRTGPTTDLSLVSSGREAAPRSPLWDAAFTGATSIPVPVGRLD